MVIGEWAAVGQKAVWAGALMGWLWEKNKKEHQRKWLGC
jgi:hypothetical protein